MARSQPLAARTGRLDPVSRVREAAACAQAAAAPCGTLAQALRRTRTMAAARAASRRRADGAGGAHAHDQRGDERDADRDHDDDPARPADRRPGRDKPRRREHRRERHLHHHRHRPDDVHARRVDRQRSLHRRWCRRFAGRVLHRVGTQCFDCGCHGDRDRARRQRAVADAGDTSRHAGRHRDADADRKRARRAGSFRHQRVDAGAARGGGSRNGHRERGDGRVSDAVQPKLVARSDRAGRKPAAAEPPRCPRRVPARPGSRRVTRRGVPHDRRHLRLLSHRSRDVRVRSDDAPAAALARDPAVRAAVLPQPDDQRDGRHDGSALDGVELATAVPTLAGQSRGLSLPRKLCAPGDAHECVVVLLRSRERSAAEQLRRRLGGSRDAELPSQSGRRRAPARRGALRPAERHAGRCDGDVGLRALARQSGAVVVSDAHDALAGIGRVERVDDTQPRHRLGSAAAGRVGSAAVSDLADLPPRQRKTELAERSFGRRRTAAAAAPEVLGRRVRDERVQRRTVAGKTDPRPADVHHQEHRAARRPSPAGVHLQSQSRLVVQPAASNVLHVERSRAPRRRAAR
jgi:hypothetical protein